MNARHIRRLPVVDDAGALVGVVSRRDLLKVFIRPDADIEAEIADVLASILLESADGITASVREGVVDLTGTVPDKGMVTVATRLAADVPGVVTVTSRVAVKASAEARGPH
jgi:CBS domain-containing protein